MNVVLYKSGTASETTNILVKVKKKHKAKGSESDNKVTRGSR